MSLKLMIEQRHSVSPVLRSAVVLSLMCFLIPMVKLQWKDKCLRPPCYIMLWGRYRLGKAKALKNHKATPPPGCLIVGSLKEPNTCWNSYFKVWHKSQASLFLTTKPYVQARRKAQLVLMLCFWGSAARSSRGCDSCGAFPSSRLLLGCDCTSKDGTSKARGFLLSRWSLWTVSCSTLNVFCLWAEGIYLPFC